MLSLSSSSSSLWYRDDHDWYRFVVSDVYTYIQLCMVNETTPLARKTKYDKKQEATAFRFRRKKNERKEMKPDDDEFKSILQHTNDSHCYILSEETIIVPTSTRLCEETNQVIESFLWDRNNDYIKETQINAQVDILRQYSMPIEVPIIARRSTSWRKCSLSHVSNGSTSEQRTCLFSDRFSV